MFKKTMIDAAVSKAAAVIGQRTKIREALRAAEAEVINARDGRLRALEVLSVRESENALLAEPASSDNRDLRAATEREELASARVVGLKRRLDESDATVIAVKTEAEAAFGEYAESEMAEAIKAYRKVTDVFLSARRRLYATAETLGQPFVCDSLRSIRIPDVENYGVMDLAAQHWSEGSDRAGLSAQEQHAPVAESLRLIKLECARIELATAEKSEADANRRQQELLAERKSSAGGMLGQVNMKTSARVFI